MTTDERAELERLRGLSLDNLLSMTQVDWLIGLIDRETDASAEARSDVEKLYALSVRYRKALEKLRDMTVWVKQ